MTSLSTSDRGSQPTEWHPTTATGVTLNLASIVLAGAGFAVFAGLYAAGHDWSGSFRLGSLDLVVFTAAVAVLLVVHEGVHGAVVALFGSRPRFGAEVVAKVLPVFYCTAPGVRFTRARFLVVALAPFVLLNLLLVVLVTWMPGSGWLVVPAAVHLGGCIGDLWMSVLTLRQPSGTLVEDLKSGLRFHPPSAAV